MTGLKDEKELREGFGLRLRQFREKEMKKQNIDFLGFAQKAGIPVDTFSSYETSELFPGVEDLVKIHRGYGVNLGWLLCNRGKMYYDSESEMLAIFDKISAEENKKHEEYKLLLKMMQIPEMEVFIFKILQAFIDLLLTADSKGNSIDVGFMLEMLGKKEFSRPEKSAGK
ncbi:MAG: helix-turn-helix transcriptional regulator [Candidatus Aminicenantes bacterium]|nr:helix-turn-helix transcriptional regulator [Candidatus Aminicenantes bacterium]